MYLNVIAVVGFATVAAVFVVEAVIAAAAVGIVAVAAAAVVTSADCCLSVQFAAAAAVENFEFEIFAAVAVVGLKVTRTMKRREHWRKQVAATKSIQLVCSQNLLVDEDEAAISSYHQQMQSAVSLSP